MFNRSLRSLSENMIEHCSPCLLQSDTRMLKKVIVNFSMLVYMVYMSYFPRSLLPLDF